MTHLFAVLALAAFAYPDATNAAAWRAESSDPLESYLDIFSHGMAIDQFRADGRECAVTFLTALPPPYLVAAYTCDNAGFRPLPSTRSRPLCYRVTDDRRAVLRYDFASLRVNAFVQVMPGVWTNFPAFRPVTAEELERLHATYRVDSVDWARPVADSGERTWLPLPLWKWASQEVPIRPRDVKSLSAHDGVRVGLDWEGQLRAIADTNAVPDRIYWEGL